MGKDKDKECKQGMDKDKECKQGMGKDKEWGQIFILCFGDFGAVGNFRNLG
jgi:hypothetical protein